MKYDIKWTSTAYKDFSQILSYIKENYGKSEVEDFITDFDNTVKLISIFPILGKVIHQQKQIRAFVISKQTTIIYRIKSKRIIILNLFDNRKHPDKLQINEVQVAYNIQKESK